MIRHVHHTSPTYNTATRTATSAASKTAAGTDSFRSLFTSTDAQQPQISATVTKEAAKPTVTVTPPQYEKDPTVSNPDGSVSALNYTQFADQATAQRMATKLGGTVATLTTDMYSAPQRSISVPGSANLVNAGIAAQLFAQYGDKPGSLAWQIINRDLGRDPMST